MALSALDDGSRPPEAAEIRGVLGKSAALWDRLIARVAGEHGGITEQWNFSGAKVGWSLRLREKGRVVVYMTPQAGAFLVGIVLSERAASAARRGDVPESVRALIDGAPRYAEGRGIRLTVASRGDLATVLELVALKTAR